MFRVQGLGFRGSGFRVAALVLPFLVALVLGVSEVRVWVYGSSIWGVGRRKRGYRHRLET